MNEHLDPIRAAIATAQQDFRRLLEVVEANGGLTLDVYVRYLSMQYHLTKGVQQPFLHLAAHADLGRRRKLRHFLVRFANEEEFHFELAARDLTNCEREPLPQPFDVELWWAYFDRTIAERPFLRLGAACVLETISATSGDIIARLFARAGFLRPDNTVFLRVHQHEEQPHGDQILEAIAAAQLEPHHFDQLHEGAQKGAILYLRMAAWALAPVVANGADRHLAAA